MGGRPGAEGDSLGDGGSEHARGVQHERWDDQVSYIHVEFVKDVQCAAVKL